MIDYKELENVPVSEWAKMWCSLNRWKWPEQLSHLKPDWWDGESSRELTNKKMVLIMPINRYIESRVGDKAVSREWNRNFMTDEQHEKWWSLRDNVNAQFEYTKNIYESTRHMPHVQK